MKKEIFKIDLECDQIIDSSCEVGINLESLKKQIEEAEKKGANFLQIDNHPIYGIISTFLKVDANHLKTL